MAAKLYGNKQTLINSLAGNPMATAGGLAATGGLPVYKTPQVNQSNPLVNEATAINKTASTGGQEFLNGLSGKIGGSTAPAPITGSPNPPAPTEVTSSINPDTGKAEINKTSTPVGQGMPGAEWNGQNYEMPGQKTPPTPPTPAPATPGTTTPPVPTAQNAFDTERNQAFDQYGNKVTPDTQTQEQIDAARNQLLGSYGTQTIEQAYNQMRNEKGVGNVEQQLADTNALIRTNQEGARNAQEQNFTSGGGMTDNGIQQLRARNSRDFIRNLSDLSNIQANTVDKLNMLNGQIDTVLKLRQQDRATTQQELKDKIELLSNKITPAEKELLKAKLDSKINSINIREQAEADRVKQENQLKMQRDFTVGDINSTDPLKRRVAIENAVNETRKQYEGMPFVRSSGAMADDIQKLVESGVPLSQAIAQNIVQPVQSAPQYQKWLESKGIAANPLDQQLKQAQIDTAKKQLEIMGKNSSDYSIQSVYDSATGTYKIIAINTHNPNEQILVNTSGTGTGNIGNGTGIDFSTNQDIINAHPNVAAFKNNNPTGLTVGVSAGLKKMLDDAGIKYTVGTARPANEGGNYLKFATVGDGLKAYQISLMHPGGANNVDIYNRLYNWSAGGNNTTPNDVKIANKAKYANDLMSAAGIPKGTTFDQLNQDQLNKLMQAHLQRESPGFIEAINKAGGNATTGQDESQRKADLLAQFDAASKKGSVKGGPGKNDIMKQLINLGVPGNKVETASNAAGWLGKTDGTAFEHLNMLEDLVKQLPDTNNKISAGIASKILDFFGSPTQTNAEMMQGLAGDELSKFYGGNGVSDRAAASGYFQGKTKAAMLAQIEQAREASMTKAKMQNELYKDATGVDYPSFSQINNTVNRKKSGGTNTTPTNTGGKTGDSLGIL